MSDVSACILARMSVLVSVSASWNSSYMTYHERLIAVVETKQLCSTLSAEFSFERVCEPITEGTVK